MKHGKKYVEAAKLYDKQTQYDKNEAISIQISVTRPSRLTSGQAATDVMRTSRSAAPLYFPTEQVRLHAFWYLPRMPRLTRPRLQVQIT